MFFGKQQGWNLTDWHYQWVVYFKFDVQLKSPQQFPAGFIASCVTGKIDNNGTQNLNYKPASAKAMLMTTQNTMLIQVLKNSLVRQSFAY